MNRAENLEKGDVGSNGHGRKEEVIRHLGGMTETISSGPIDDDYPTTDLGNCRRFVAAHGADLRWAPQLGTYLAWDGSRWKEDITDEATRRAKQMVDDMLASALALTGSARDELLKHGIRSSAAGRLRATVELARSEPGIPVTVDHLDTDPFLLNVENGIVDLRTGTLLDHDRDRLCTKMAAAAYIPNTPAPNWQRFLVDAFDGDTDLIEFVQRYAGYSLTGDVSEHKIVFATGPGGNGKSTFLNAIRGGVGNYGMTLDPRVLMVSAHDEHPTGLTDLRGARLVTTIETENGRRIAEALLKQITGGDPIRARRMRCDYFQFQPTHKLWLAGNHLPRIKGSDHGIWRRIVVVPFDVTFTGDREDKHLGDKLHDERDGILAWMVEGCLAWQRDGLKVPPRVAMATDDYRTNEDHLGRFLADCTVTGENTCVSTKALREAYETWCEENGETAWSAQAIGRELTSRGFDSTRLGEARTRSWLGIGLLDRLFSETPSSRGGDRL
jgi:putative DNA primase/helicase